MTFRFLLALSALLLTVTASQSYANTSTNLAGATPTQAITSEEAYQIATEAYTFFYPLVTMEITRRVSTNSPANQLPGRGPMNTLVHMRAFPDAKFRDVIRPNFDTLYSVAWMDISKEPMVLSMPDTKGRYYLMPLLDMWTNVFASPGKRTSGTSAKNFLIVKEGWKGKVPKNVEVITAPTSVIWMIGRIQTNGPADYPAVHAIQDAMKVVTLTEWNTGKTKAVKFTPNTNIDMKTPPLDQVNNMAAADFFKLASETMKSNPPQETDWSTLERLKKIGFITGQTYNLSTQSPEIQKAIIRGAKDALANFTAKLPTLATVTDGWQMNTNTMGVYGNYYLKRAIVAMAGLGANQAEDAIYPIALTDAKGEKFYGKNKYVLHFDKSELPPVEAFWSITMYDEQGFQVANEINRFAIGDRDSLKYNSDGSLDLYIQPKNPGAEKASNWLPSPASGELGITMRLYAPSQKVTEGQWSPPAIVRR